MADTEKEREAVIMRHEESVDLINDAPIAGEEDNHLPLGRALKSYPKIAGYACFVTVAILLWGYDLVIVGTVSSIPAFQMVFGRAYEDRYIIPSSWFSVWQISTNIGLMAGALLCGWLQDRIGRRWSLFASSMVISASVAICYVSDLPPSLGGKRGLFFVAKTVQGFGVGGMMCTTQTWLSEVLPVSLRGPFMAFFPIFKLLGQLVGALVSFSVINSEEPSAYRLCFATQWPFSGLLSILALLLPESPAYLLRSSKPIAAHKAMARLQGGTLASLDQVDRSLSQLRSVIEAEKGDSHSGGESYLACLKGVHLRRTMLVCFAEYLPLFFGLPLLGSSSYFLQQIGMDPTTSVIFLIAGIAVGLIASCIAFYTMSKLGRRTLILVSMSVITVFWTGVGISGAWRGSAGSMWFTAIGTMVVVFMAGIGVWPAGYAVASEVSALRLRSKTQGIGWLSYGLGTLIFGVTTPYLYNPDAGNIGSYTAFFFTGWAGFAVVITFFYVPEMKGRSPREIDRMFDVGLKARKFRSWEGTEPGTMNAS